jgi:hypothetical protein
MHVCLKARLLKCYTLFEYRRTFSYANTGNVENVPHKFIFVAHITIVFVAHISIVFALPSASSISPWHICMQHPYEIILKVNLPFKILLCGVIY